MLAGSETKRASKQESEQASGPKKRPFQYVFSFAKNYFSFGQNHFSFGQNYFSFAQNYFSFAQNYFSFAQNYFSFSSRSIMGALTYYFYIVKKVNTVFQKCK